LRQNDLKIGCLIKCVKSYDDVEKNKILILISIKKCKTYRTKKDNILFDGENTIMVCEFFNNDFDIIYPR